MNVKKIKYDKDSRNSGTFLFCVLFILLFLFVSKPVFAAAGDSINNTATLNYNISGIAGTSTASTRFTEDRLINFTVSKINDGVYDRVVNGMTGAVMAFRILNSGNATQDFLLAAVNTTPNPFSSPADNFDTLSPMRTFVESGATPGYQASQDTAVFVDELAPNATAVVYVVASIPAGLKSGDVAAVALIAQVAEGGAKGIEGAAITHDDNGRISPANPASGYSNGATMVTAGSSVNTANTIGMDTVFNDPAGNKTEDVSSAMVQDVAGNGQHADAGAYRVAPPVLIVKSVKVIDSLGGNKPYPSATLRYQLDVSVAGNTRVDNLVVKDFIPANTSYVGGSLSLNGVAQTDANDVPADYSQAISISTKPVTSIAVDLSQGGTKSVLPGVTNVIIFSVTIN